MKRKLFLTCAVLLLIAVFGQFALAKTTINWWLGSWWKEAAPGVAEKFEKENPNIDVKVELIPYEGYTERTMISAMGPQPPDVMALDAVSFNVLADKGLLEVLDPYIEKTGKDANGYFPAAWNMGKFKGKMFAISDRISSYALYYNVKMFKEAGLDPNNPPKTYDEILQYAKKMTNREEGKYGWLVAASKTNPNNAVYFIFELIWAFGGDVLNADCTKAVINSPEAKAGVKFWTDLYLKDKVVPPGIMTYNANDCARLFGAGNIGMFITGDFGYGNIAETAAKDFEFKVSVPPQSVLTGWVLAIPKNAKNKEEAWRLIDWFTDPKNLPELNIRTPSTRSAVEHPKWNTPEIKPFFESAEIARVLPPTPKWPEIADIIMTQLHKILLEEQSVDESMDEAARLIDKVLE